MPIVDFRGMGDIDLPDEWSNDEVESYIKDHYDEFLKGFRGQQIKESERGLMLTDVPTPVLVPLPVGGTFNVNAETIAAPVATAGRSVWEALRFIDRLGARSAGGGMGIGYTGTPIPGGLAKTAEEAEAAQGNFLQDQIEANQAFFPQSKEPGLAEQVAGVGGTALPFLVNPALGLGLYGGSQGEQEYQRAREEGATAAQAEAQGFVGAGAGMATELFGAPFRLSRVLRMALSKEPKTVLGMALKSGVREMIQEPTENAILDAAARVTYGAQDRNPFDIAQRWQEAKVGGIAGALMGGGTGVAMRTQRPSVPGITTDTGERGGMVDLPTTEEGEAFEPLPPIPIDQVLPTPIEVAQSQTPETATATEATIKEFAAPVATATVPVATEAATGQPEAGAPVLTAPSQEAPNADTIQSPASLLVQVPPTTGEAVGQGIRSPEQPAAARPQEETQGEVTAAIPPKEVIQNAAQEKGLQEVAAPEPVTAAPDANRVRLKSTGPQTWTVLNQLPPAAGDQPGETFFRVKNDRTGEETTVESRDIIPIKEQVPGTAARTPAKPAAQQHAEANAELTAMGMDPTTFKSIAQKKQAIRRAKSKRNAVPDVPSRGITEAQGRKAIRKLTGNDTHPNITLVYLPEETWGAEVEGDQIALNLANTNSLASAVDKLREEMVHAVWADPEIQDLLRSIVANVTDAEVRSELQTRANQGLDVQPAVIVEEATIARIIRQANTMGTGAWRLVSKIIDKVKQLFGIKVERADAVKVLDYALRTFSQQSGTEVKYAAGDIKQTKGFFNGYTGNYIATDEQELLDLAEAYIQSKNADPTVILGELNQSGVIKDERIRYPIVVGMMMRLSVQKQQAKSLAEKVRLSNLIFDFSEAGKQKGTTWGQTGSAMQAGIKVSQPFHVSWALNNYINQKQRDLGVKWTPGQFIDVQKAQKTAGGLAGKTIIGTVGIQKAPPTKGQKAPKFPPSLVKLKAMLKKLGKANGIDFKTVFESASQDQAKFRMDLYRFVHNDPQFSDLTTEQRQELATALDQAWQLLQSDIFNHEWRKVQLPQNQKESDRKRFLKATPKLLRMANSGQLTYQVFLDELGKKYGIPSLLSDTVAEVEKLSNEYGNTPGDQVQKRVKLLQQMQDTVFSVDSIDPWMIMRDAWYGNVLSATRTLMSVGMGTLVKGAIDTALRGIRASITPKPENITWGQHKKTIARSMWQFVTDLGEGIVNAVDLARTGDISRVAGMEERLKTVMSFQNTPDTLETMMRGTKTWKEMADFWKRSNTWGKLAQITSLSGRMAFTRRFMTGLDLFASIGVRDAAATLNALTSGQADRVEWAVNRYNRANRDRAKQMAIDELPKDAKWVDIRNRTREIIEAQANEEDRQAGLDAAAIAALNADPDGWLGEAYKLIAKLPFPLRAGTQLSFARAMIQMIQTASNVAPGIGAFNYARAATTGTMSKQELSKSDVRRLWGMFDKDGKPVSRAKKELILMQQAMGLILTIALWMTFVPDDEDNPQEDKFIDLTGGFKGVPPQKRGQLYDAGIRPYQLRIGKFQITYRDWPIAPVLAMFGNIRDKQKYTKENWDEQSQIERIFNGWANGLIYVKDLSMIGNLAQALGISSYATDETDAGALNRAVSNLVAPTLAGIVPAKSLLNEVYNLFDPTKYRKDSWMDSWTKAMPAGQNAIYSTPQSKVTGGNREQRLLPWSRHFSTVENDPLMVALRAQYQQGVFLPNPSKAVRIYRPEKRQMDQMTDAEYVLYEKESGQMVGMMLRQNVEAITKLQREVAIKYFADVAQRAHEYAKAVVQQKIFSGR